MKKEYEPSNRVMKYLYVGTLTIMYITVQIVLFSYPVILAVGNVVIETSSVWFLWGFYEESRKR